MIIKNKKEFTRYIRKTYKNKLIAMILLAVGIISTSISDGDVTFLVFTMMIGLPLFFTRKNYIS